MGPMHVAAIWARLVAAVIDIAPSWIWKPGNLRLVGSHTLHFRFGHEGRRTVEWDSRVVAIGRSTWAPRQEPPPS
jgi:hypothetical protein